MLEDKQPASGPIPGNVYDKYGTDNPIARKLMRGFDRRMLELFKQLDPVQSILEVGCGEGELTKKLSDHFTGAQILGSDISGDVIAEAKIKHPELNFEVRSVYNVSGGNKKYDLVVASEVLEHLEDPQAALLELTKVTNSYIFISVPREPLWRILNCARLKYLAQFGNTPGHVQHWSTSAFLRFLAQAVEIIDIRTPLPWTQVLCKRSGG